MNVAIFQYNNYFNRIVKYAGPFLDDYITKSKAYETFVNVNLKPNDFIFAKVIINRDSPDGFEPDYFVSVDPGPNQLVVSRWFVLEYRQIRTGQYELSLRRDVIADNLAAVKESKAMIERGPLPVNSPLLLNSEGFSFNQIKSNEHLIKDESGTPWIVIYLSRDTDDESYIVGSSKTSGGFDELSGLGLELVDDQDPTKGATMNGLDEASILTRVDSVSITFENKILSESSFILNLALQKPSIGSAEAEEYGAYTQAQLDRGARKMGDLIFLQQSTAYETIRGYDGLASKSELMKILSMDGKIVYYSTLGKYYQIAIINSENQESVEDITTEESLPVFQMIKNFNEIFVSDDDYYQFLDPSTYYIKIYKKIIRLGLTEVYPENTIRTKISASRNHVSDAPYDIAAMPFNLDNLAIAQRLATTPVAEGKKRQVYDIQILPFCPFRSMLTQNGVLDVDYSPIELSDNGDWVEIGKLLFCLSCSDSFMINDDFPWTAVYAYDQNETKIFNECTAFRLCSPNYASAFEFSVAKNAGNVEAWRVDFTYRPYSPYVHVAPFFSGIYGNFNNDARGLILSGDFSIDAVSSAWVDYQIQNKNFQNIFNTQIKTMDDFRQLERITRGLGAAAGSVAAGVGAGVASGNALIGAATFVGSAATGAFDFAMNEERFQIQRRQTVELFNYNIGNVKALPNTLTKISSYNVNNKYFPIVEYYSATLEEKEYFLEFLNVYNYRVGVVGKIGDFLGYGWKEREYIKAKLILNEQVGGDSHLLNEIYKELDQGVFFDESAR